MSDTEKAAYDWARNTAASWEAGYPVDKRDLASALAFLKAYNCLD